MILHSYLSYKWFICLCHMMILEKYARLMIGIRLDLIASRKRISDVLMNVMEHKLLLGNVILMSVLACCVIRLVSITDSVLPSQLDVF